MKDLEKLENEIITNFIGNRINIELIGDITYTLKIENAKFLLNRVYLIFSDEKENQLNICLDEVGEISIEEGMIEIYFNYIPLLHFDFITKI